MPWYKHFCHPKISEKGEDDYVGHDGINADMENLECAEGTEPLLFYSF